jgi:hypothetical protein
MSHPIFHRIVVVEASLYADGPFNTGHTQDVFAAARTSGERARHARTRGAQPCPPRERADRVVHLAPCPVLTVRDPSGDR